MSLIRHQSSLRTEEVVEKLKALIQSGELKPGDRLLAQRDLSKRLAVSRASLREALRLLAGMGLLEITPSGTYVRRANVDDVVPPLVLVMSQTARDVYNLLEARWVLESEASKLAAIRADRIDLARLRELTENLRRELESGQYTGQSDSSFHVQIVSSAKNSVLSTLMSVLVSLMPNQYAEIRQEMMMRFPRRFYDQHLRIVEAMENRDPEGAAAFVRAHLEFTMDKFLEIMRETGTCMDGTADEGAPFREGTHQDS